MRESGAAGSTSGLAGIVGGRSWEQHFAAGFGPEKPGETQNFEAEWACRCPILLCASTPKAGIRRGIRGRQFRAPDSATAEPGSACPEPVSEHADDVIWLPSYSRARPRGDRDAGAA